MKLPPIQYEAEFNNACILGVKLTSTGFCGGDAGHGGKTLITFKDRGGTAMEVVKNEDGEITLGFYGDAELTVLADALHHLAKELSQFRDEATE